MIRRITYLALFIGATLAIINLSLTNTLAGEGGKLSDINHQKEIESQTVEKLEQEIMTATSLTRINKRGIELGLTETIR